MCHYNLSSERLLLLKYKVGVGIIEMNNIHSSQIKKLRTNFHNKMNMSHTTNHMGHMLTYLTSYLT